MQRRTFLKQTGLASGAILLPALLNYSCGKASDNKNRKLVMIQLSGGNDSLNTLVPYTDENYFIKRPSIAIGSDEVLKLNERYGLNPAMKSLLDVYRSGNMLIINGAGFNEREDSHYQASRIWQTAFINPVDEQSWITRFHEHQQVNKDISGTEKKDNILLQEEDTIFCTQSDFRSCLDEVATAMNQQADSRIFHLSLDGFDTHHMQRAKHDNLLTCLSDDLNHFLDELKDKGQKDNVLIMVFSEFGRAVAENNKRGTDHGAGGCVFIFGNKLKQKGVYNEPSSLSNSILNVEVDFRNIYATILNNWFKTDATKILDKEYEVMRWI